MLVPALVLALLPSILAVEGPIRERVRGDVQIKTDLAEDEVEAVFEEVEIARRETVALLEKMGLGRKSSRAVRIRLFALEADYEDFRRRTFDQETKLRSLSFYNSTDREIGAAWQGGSPSARGELRGQVSREVLFNYSKNPPPWLEEGIFGWVEGLLVDAWGDPVDTLNRRRLEQIRRVLQGGDYCPLYELMDLREPQFYGVSGGGPSDARWPRETLYAESWAVLHFLIDSKEPSDQKLLRAAGERLDSGRWAQAQWKKELEELEPRWKRFLFDPAIGAFGDALREAWEALPNDPKRARAAAAEAARLDEKSVSAKRALAHAALESEDHRTAILAFQELVEMRPKDLDVAVGLARARFFAGREAGDKALVDQALKAALDAGERLASGERWRAYVLAAEICEQKEDPKATLKWVREARKQKGVPRDVDTRLEDWEHALVQAAIK